MNTNLTVKLSSDTNSIPVKYRVVEISVGTSLADTYCVLTVEKVGWDTGEHYEAWTDRRETTGMVGTLGDFSVAALSDLKTYNVRTPSTDI